MSRLIYDIISRKTEQRDDKLLSYLVAYHADLITGPSHTGGKHNSLINSSSSRVHLTVNNILRVSYPRIAAVATREPEGALLCKSCAIAQLPFGARRGMLFRARYDRRMESPDIARPAWQCFLPSSSRTERRLRSVTLLSIGLRTYALTGPHGDF